MKKFLSMLLALTMCLSLAATALAAEEETEAANEPAAQTEASHTHVYAESPFTGIVRDNYTSNGHAYVENGRKQTCICGDTRIVGPVEYRTHLMQTTVYGVALNEYGETVTTYLHECRSCDYYTINTSSMWTPN